MDWKRKISRGTVRCAHRLVVASHDSAHIRRYCAETIRMTITRTVPSVHVEVVKNAFERLISDDGFCLTTPRLLLAKDCVKELQGKLDEPPM